MNPGSCPPVLVPQVLLTRSIATGYKTTKFSVNGDVKSNATATAKDEEYDDIVAGPELPPEAEEDGGLDDEEGRFFGGGITIETAEVLDFIDERDKDELAVSLIVDSLYY